jgi:16S rRNA (cytosine967-C5)-methyltransferase
MAGARSAALKALLHVETGKGYSNLVLDSVLNAASLSPLDRSLTAAIFYGVLERRIALDYILGFYSKRPVEKLSPSVREILRMGAYQIRYLTKIPPSAAVNESVKLAKENGAFHAAGFVNAVLRSMLREPEKVKPPDRSAEPLLWRSIFFSCPVPLIEFWQKSYGKELTDSILKGATSQADVFLRVNNTRISEQQLIERLRGEGIEAEPAPWPENALRVKSNAGNLRRTSCYAEGLFHVQDISSQLCCRALAPQPGEHVLDVCAAPGGKTFTLAERMGNRGRVDAFDLYPARVALIRKGAERMGLSIIRAFVRDAAEPKKSPPSAESVLCDVPCSGLGVIRRKPEIRYKFPASIDSLPDLQYRILCKSSGLVKAGGVLVYSTCTLNPAENGDVAEKFREENRNFQPLSLHLPEGIARRFQEPENQLTLFPCAGGSDGFFLSAFRKE